MRFYTYILSFILLPLGLAMAQSPLLVEEKQMANLDLAYIENLDTGEIRNGKLSEAAGKVVIIDFWATWCGPCIVKMGELADLKKQFPDELEIISISDEPLEKIIPFIQKRNFPFKFVQDVGSVHSLNYNVGALPFTILLNQKGIIKAVNNSSALRSEIIVNMIDDKPVVIPKLKRVFEVNLADTTTKNLKIRKMLTGFKPQIPSFAKDETRGEYAGRRITIFNKTIQEMVAMLSNNRWEQGIIFSPDDAVGNPENLFCIDLIFDEEHAPQRAKLALNFLANRFPEIKTRNETVRGYVIKVGNAANIPEKADANVQLISTATTEDLAITLQQLLQTPVKNEAAFKQRFVMTLSRVPADIVLIKRILERIGLVLQEAEFVEKRYFVD